MTKEEFVEECVGLVMSTYAQGQSTEEIFRIIYAKYIEEWNCDVCGCSDRERNRIHDSVRCVNCNTVFANI